MYSCCCFFNFAYRLNQEENKNISSPLRMTISTTNVPTTLQSSTKHHATSISPFFQSVLFSIFLLPFFGYVFCSLQDKRVRRSTKVDGVVRRKLDFSLFAAVHNGITFLIYLFSLKSF